MSRTAIVTGASRGIGRAVANRLADIASCLDDDAEVTRAFDGLLIWRRAFGAYRLARRSAR